MMKHIVITEVDVKTKVPCTVEPQRTGPSMPQIKGLVLDWADKSTWPVEINSTGKYLRAPKYYGTCDDDADLTVAGVLEELTQVEWTTRKHDEFYARQPYPSWVWNSFDFTWSSPVPYPEDAGTGEPPKRYTWDEETTSWVERETA
jgi:hypothetical protein